jgi:ATP-dependent RNA helicase HelY
VAPGGTRAAFLASLGFELDPFQMKGLDAIDAGGSVLVAAPTGSGKTVVAEYALARALSEGAKAFYTTPLKALSNQKYADLCQRHGPESVGLLTGDNAVNADADLVVMTTEVLRNMIYAGSPALERLRYVVLDEVHYLQDPYRGAVWEEVIILAPPGVRLVCLSATVSNAEEVADWVRSVRGPTAAVIEENRPVQLRHLYLVGDRTSGRAHLLPTFVSGRPNPEASALDRRRRQTGGGRPARSRLYTPRRTEVVERLEEEDLLPAIYFIFSRAGCDQAVRQALSEGVRLTTPEERAAVRAIAEAKVTALSDEDLRVLDYGWWLTGLEAGLASHHAGLVPPFKEAVEECFAASLVKVVFATETLSLGINMPARSVVIEKLSKFSGERHQALTPGEYTQITGRAGRRGIDRVGYAVVLWSPFVPFGQVAGLASARTYELSSSFRPTYNMAANLVHRYQPEEAHHLLSLSFAQYRADAEAARVEARLTRPKSGGGRARLERRAKARTQSLARQLDRVLALLAERGYVEGWTLTAAGERLRRLYHELDLLVAEAMEAGLFDGLDPPALAGLLSVFTYESRGPIPLIPSFPDPELRRRWQAVEDLRSRLARDEARSGLPAIRPVDPGFVALAHAWAGGQRLERVLGEEPVSGGDFVRNMKQLVDLLQQVGQVAPDPITARHARHAAGEVFRGVVAASSVLDTLDPGEE